MLFLVAVLCRLHPSDASRTIVVTIAIPRLFMADLTRKPDQDADAKPESGRVSRRSFLSHLGAAGIAATAPPLLAATPPTPSAACAQDDPACAGNMPVTLRVNGQDHKLNLDPRTTLLDALRETPRPHRHQKGLRPRPVRRLHRPRQRPPRQRLPHPRRHAAGREITTIEGLGAPATPPPRAGRLPRARRLPVRLLHAGQIMSAVAC